MPKKGWIFVFLTGFSLGLIGYIGAIDERITKNNQELLCQPWQIRDSYRHLFGRPVDYCADPPHRITW